MAHPSRDTLGRAEGYNGMSDLPTGARGSPNVLVGGHSARWLTDKKHLKGHARLCKSVPLSDGWGPALRPT